MVSELSLSLQSRICQQGTPFLDMESGIDDIEMSLVSNVTDVIVPFTKVRSTRITCLQNKPPKKPNIER